MLYKYWLFSWCTWCNMHQKNSILTEVSAEVNIDFFLVHITSCTPAESPYLFYYITSQQKGPTTTLFTLFCAIYLSIFFVLLLVPGSSVFTLSRLFTKLTKTKRNGLRKGHLPLKAPSPGEWRKIYDVFAFIYLFIYFIFITDFNDIVKNSICFYRQS